MPRPPALSTSKINSVLFVTRTHELMTGIIGSVVTILSFMVILWWLSASTPLPLFGADRAFPGYLIWAALAYAAAGTFISGANAPSWW